MRQGNLVRLGLVTAWLVTWSTLAAAQPNINCDALIANAENNLSHVTVETSANQSVYGKRNDINWHAPRMGDELPLFLVLEAPAETRFEGTGFNAFAKGAQPRIGLTGNGRDVAAVVPLHRLAAYDSVNGAIGVKLYRSGRNILQWSVRTGRECGYRVLRKSQSIDIAVATGRPDVIVQDRFAIGKPIKRIRSNDGRYDLLVFKGRYEVHEVESGARILEREGNDPNFSPSARFVAAFDPTRDDLTKGGYDIIDLVSGEKIHEARDGLLAWARDDSILFDASGLYPTVQPVQTLINGRSFQGLSGTKPPIVIHSEFQLILNLEKGVIVRRFPGSQTGTVALDDLATGESHILGENSDVIPLLDLNTSLSRLFGGGLDKLPDSWVIGEPIKLSHDGYYRNFLKYPLDRIPKNFTPLGSWQGAQFIRHQTLTGQSPTKEAVATAALTGTAVKGRALSVEVAQKFEPQTLISNLEDQGVTFDRGQLIASERPPNDRRGNVDPKSQSYNRRLVALLSGAAGNFVNASHNDPYDPKRSEEHLHLKDVVDLWKISDRHFLLREFYVQGSARLGTGGLWMVDRNMRKVSNVADFSVPETEKKPADQNNGGPGNVTDEATRFVVRTTSSGHVIFANISERSAEMFDPVNRTYVGTTHQLPQGTLVTDMRLSKDGRLLFQFNSDGSFHIHNARVGGVVLSGHFVDNEIVVYRPDGLFDSSYEGSQSVQVRFPGLSGVHGFSQFASLLKRDGLLNDVLNERTIEPAPTLPGAPPEATIKLAVSSANVVAAEVNARSSTGLKSVRLYIDGALADEKAASGERTTVRFDLSDPGAGRPIAAVAVDRHGILSLPTIVSMPGRATPKGRLFGLSVGVDEYNDPKIDTLTGAKKDALSLLNTLKAIGPRAYAEVQTENLNDAAATPEAIVSVFKRMVEQAGPQDTVVFFFAGHGVDAKEHGFRLVTTNSRIADLAGTSLASADLRSIIATSRARVILLLDACQSGSAGNEFRASNDALASQLVTGSGAPVLVLAAAKGREFSLEEPNGAGGLFTTALTVALTSERDKHDRNRNGLLEAGELYLAVKERVVRLSTTIAEADKKRTDIADKDRRKPHTPWLERNAMVGDFPLF